MATSTDVHPPMDTLMAYVQGKLGADMSKAVEAHLEGCSPCVEVASRAAASASGEAILRRFGAVHGHQGKAASAAKPDDTPTNQATAPMSAELTNLPPELRQLPQYKILRELGRGGMGAVYLARRRDDSLVRFEALKVTTDNSPAALERFQQGIRATAKLGSHTNIASAYNVLRQGRHVILAMEYVEGKDLATIVQFKGPLPVVNACRYTWHAAKGLQHAYKHGIVHRDIKPQNLIADTKTGNVKIVDFGLAKIRQEEKTGPGLTTTLGQCFGTPDYIAPEQTQNSSAVDTRADIYSLGCTLYHLLAGKPPFQRESPSKLLQAHLWDEATPLNTLRKDVPPELAAVVAKMMAKRPEDRYQEPSEVAKALQSFAQVPPKLPVESTKPQDSEVRSTGQGTNTSLGARLSRGRVIRVGKTWL